MERELLQGQCLPRLWLLLQTSGTDLQASRLPGLQAMLRECGEGWDGEELRRQREKEEKAPVES